MTMRKVFELYQTKQDEYQSICETVKANIGKYDFRNPEIARGIL
jgi:hypothetical protein